VFRVKKVSGRDVLGSVGVKILVGQGELYDMEEMLMVDVSVGAWNMCKYYMM
jgi:hypothetical protein